MTRLAVISTHPIQYYAPWFRHIAGAIDGDLKVFYLWDFGVTDQVDPAFLQTLRWDVPLLEGYDWEMIPNRSRRPGTDHFWGIDNPELAPRLEAWRPTAVLCLGYNFASFLRLLLFWPSRRCPLLLRGDSHRLTPRRSKELVPKAGADPSLSSLHGLFVCWQGESRLSATARCLRSSAIL